VHGDYGSIANFPIKNTRNISSDVWNVLRYFKDFIGSFLDFWRKPRAVRNAGCETLIYSF